MITKFKAQNRELAQAKQSGAPQKLTKVPTVIMRIRPENRVCLFGRTGSGKTTLARQILTSEQAHDLPVVVLDPKFDFKPPPSTDEEHRYKIVAEYDPSLLKQIVRITPDEHESEGWDDAINGAWIRGDGVLYNDECTLITPARTIRPSLGKAIRTGRSRGLGVWTASQRPKDLPSAIFTESEHFFIFHLTFSADRDKVVSFTSDNMLAPTSRINKHDFVYYDVIGNRTILVRYTRKGSQ